MLLTSGYSKDSGARYRAPRRVLFPTILLISAFFAACDARPTGPGFDEGEATAIQLSLSEVELASGDTARLKAVLLGPQGQPLLPPSAGQPKTGAPVLWTSSDAGIVSVSRSGLVQAKQNGDVRITAASGNLRASTQVKVRGNAKDIVISPKVDTLTALGATVQLSATVLDPKGKKVANASVDWSSSNAEVATVSGAGKVTAIAAGAVIIVASARGDSDTARINVIPVSTPTVASVSVSPTPLALTTGEDEPLSAKALGQDGKVIEGLGFSWSSSDANVAAVDEDGFVTANGAGSATISATVAGVSGKAAVTVTNPSSPAPPAPPPGAGQTAELPRVYIDTRYQAPGGSVIKVPAGGDLQAALNAAKRGDIVELQAGATFSGNFTLPAKPGSGWVVVRSSGAVPAEGTRFTPAQAGQLAKLVSNRGDRRVLETESGASHYRLIGLELTFAPSVTYAGTILDLSGSNNVVVDRSYIHGHANLDFQRCINMNSDWSAVIDSYISECHGKSYSDTQAIMAWATHGPLKIVNNYLEGAGENVMIGGARPRSTGLPEDIEIRFNHFRKPWSWQGVWPVKNLFEIKFGRRFLVEGNVFEGNWKSGQDGMAINLKMSDSSGNYTTAGGMESADVTFRYNIIRDADGGFKAYSVRRLVVEHNLIHEIGTRTGNNRRLWAFGGGLHDLVVRNNTALDGVSPYIYGGTNQRAKFIDNVWLAYRFKGSPSEGIPTLDQHFPDWTWSGMCLITMKYSQSYPSGTVNPATQEETVNGFTVRSNSPCAGKGVDVAQLTQLTSGVVK